MTEPPASSGGDLPRGLKGVRGVLALFGKQLFLLPFNLVTAIALVRVLDPVDFGVFAVGLLLFTGVTLFSDLGAAAALVVRRDDPDERTIGSVLGLDLTASTFLATLVCLGAAPIAVATGLPPDADWFLRGMVLVAAANGFVKMSTVLLERRLAFHQLAPVEVAAAVVERLTVVALALAGAAYWSFLAGLAAGVALRATAQCRLAGWRPIPRFSPGALRGVLPFGVFFLGGNATTLLRDHLGALVAAPLFGAERAGLIKWAHDFSFTISQMLTQVATRVAFPYLSRVPDDAPRRRRATIALVRGQMLVTAPILGLACALLPEIITVVLHVKWMPARLAFGLFALLHLAGNLTTPLVALLNAMGRSRLTFGVLAAWTALVWILVFPLSQTFGFLGVPLTLAVAVALPAGVLVVVTGRHTPLDLLHSVLTPTAAASCAAGALVALKGEAGHTLIGLAALGLVGAALYALFLLLFERGRIVSDMNRGWRLVREYLDRR